jgi:VWFA-related protein
MFSCTSPSPAVQAGHRFPRAFVASMCLVGLLLGTQFAFAQSQSQTPSGQQQPAPPEAGGPQTDVGPYAIPKKKDEPPPPPPPEKPKKVEGMPDYSLHVDVPVVTIPTMVLTKDGQFISTLQKENFKIYEDGAEQKISNFNVEDAPITAVLLVEFASGDYYFFNDLLTASYSFANTLKKNDWLAVISYDIKPYILADFTQDKGEVYGALNQLRIPGFSETNLFDALYDTLDRVDRLDGHKYVILITTGIDTFSKLNLDQITKKIKTTKDVTIFPISVGWAMREYFDSHGGVAPHGGVNPLFASNMDYLQADNEMRTFAKLTGGRAYFPRFQAEFPEIFRDIGGDIRKQYQISYHPSNPKMDGSYRKLKVEVVAPDGGPLKIKDQKGKDLKYDVVAREGYTAKHVVE